MVMSVSVAPSAVLLRQRPSEHRAEAAIPRALLGAVGVRREAPRDGVARCKSNVLYLGFCSQMAKIGTLLILSSPKAFVSKWIKSEPLDMFVGHNRLSPSLLTLCS